MRSLKLWFKNLFGTNRRSRTVRYMFPAAILTAAALGASVVTSQAGSYVKLQTTTTAVESGQRFAVDIYVFAEQPINAVDIQVDFDASAVEVLEVDRGQSVLTLWTEDPVVTNDSVTLRGGTFRKGFLGEHKIASIDLRAKETGISTVQTSNIMLLAGDGSGTKVQAVETNQNAVKMYVYDQNSDLSGIDARFSIQLLTDIDGDGKVSFHDIGSFMAAWTTRGQLYDFNADGRMSFGDFSILLADYFTGR